MVVLEQLLNTLPDEVRIWVVERKPKSSLEAGQSRGRAASRRLHPGQKDERRKEDEAGSEEERRAKRDSVPSLSENRTPCQGLQERIPERRKD